MANSKYQIKIEAIIDQAQLQQQLNKVTASKSIKVKAQVDLDASSIDAQLQKWQNAITRMQVGKTSIFNTPEVQRDLQNLGALMNTFGKNGGASIGEVNLAFDKLKTTVSVVSENMKMMQQQSTDISKNQKMMAALQAQAIKENEIFNKRKQQINEYAQQWENALAKMQARAPAAFATDKVQEQVGVLRQLIEQYKVGAVPIGQVKTQLDNVRTSLIQSSSAMQAVNKDGMGLVNMFELAAKKVAIWAVSTGLIYGALRQIRDGVQYIKELDKELTNVSIVTGMNAAQVGALAQQYNQLATELGATTKQVAQGSIEWFRQGKTVAETAKLMESTMQMSKLGNMEAADSTEALTSIMNGFKLEAEDTSRVIDKLVALDNSYATSVAEISSALQRSANSAQQAGVSFDELASYITVVSAVTRKSSESIGESFKTIFARMENIKLGKMFEDDTTNINDVEKALSLVNIKIRDTEFSFRPMGDVMDEIAAKWINMNELEQSAVANAIAGVRQRENFITLMRNYNQVLQAQEIQLESTGLATQRFGVYLDSVEAKTNKFTAAWEKLAYNTVNSEFIKSMIDFGTALLGVLDKIGLVNAAVLVLTAVLSTRLMVVIPGVTQAIFALMGSLTSLVTTSTTATAAVATLSIALGPVALIAVILAGVAAFNALNVTMAETYANFEKLRSETESNRNELNSLAEEYEALANKSNKTAEETTRLLDIQSILNTKYGALESGVNAYSAAIEGNSKAIAENIEWMRKQANFEAEKFLEENKSAYIKAKKFLEESTLREGGRAGKGGRSGPTVTVEEYRRILSDRIARGEDALGINQKILNNLNEQIDAAQKLVIETEHYKNLLQEAAPKSSMVGLGSMFSDALSSVIGDIEQVKDLSQQFEDLELFISDPLGKAFDEYNEKQTEAGIKAAELRAAIGELQALGPIETLSPEQLTELGDLQYELDGVEQGIMDTAAAYEHSTRVAIINLALQRIAMLGLKGEAADTAYAMVWNLAEAWGVIGQSTRTAVETMDTAFRYLADGTEASAVLAQNEIAKLAEMANAVSGDYYLNFRITTSGQVVAPQATGMGALRAFENTGNVPGKVVGTTRAAYPGFGGFSKTASGGGKAEKEKEDTRTASALHSMIINFIRDQKEAEKDLLEQQKDGLKEQLEGYKKVIDARKELLDTQKEELEYQEEINEKNRDIAKIKDELAVLELDNSLESQAKQLELKEDLKNAEDDLMKTQRDKSFEVQKEALDKEYEAFEKNIDEEVLLVEEKINAIDEFLSKSGLLAQEAINMMKDKSKSLYEQLVKWNAEYGSGIKADVTKAWDDAYAALKRYGNLAAAIRGQEGFGDSDGLGGGGSGGNLNWKRQYRIPEGSKDWEEASKLGKTEFLKKHPEYKKHHTGLDAGPIGGIQLPGNEVVIKALKGEYLMNQDDILGIKRNLPKIAQTISNMTSKTGDLSIGNLINVEGNLDEKILPDIRKLTKEVVHQINFELMKRGYTREGWIYST